MSMLPNKQGLSLIGHSIKALLLKLKEKQGKDKVPKLLRKSNVPFY